MTRLAVLVVLALMAAQAQAQTPNPRSELPPGIAPLLMEVRPVFEAGALSQHPVPPLTGFQLSRVRQAMGLRESGRIEAARDTLRRLDAEVPHHPLVLTELARTDVARGDWQAVEKLGKSERAAQRDSLLLGHELAEALEHLRKPREAAQVALECWVVRPTEAEWALTTITRVAGADSKAIRESLRHAAEQRPNRMDLQSGTARLDWKMGDGSTAMKELVAADRPGFTPPLRWRFADELLRTGATRDTMGAIDALVSMAGDIRFDPSHRMMAARRVMDVHKARGTVRAGAPELYKALKDLPVPTWNPDLVVDIARGLREAGQTAEARSLLDTPELRGRERDQLTLERALNDLRDGPPERAIAPLKQIEQTSPEAQFRFAEALFFAGMSDSALAVYKRVSEDPNGSFTGAAYDRIFLIEDAKPKTALPAVGRLMYLDWRGDTKAALALADSLYQSLPRDALWAQVAMFLSARLDAAGQAQAALAPLLEVADKLPDDRLAPLARQRAGDIYLFRLKDEPQALAQYEACLLRYPKAWNSAEVRRRLDALRKRRF